MTIRPSPPVTGVMMPPPGPPPPFDAAALIDRWRAAWPQALAAWSKFTRLRDPRLCASRVEAAQEGLSGSFAMIRLLDQSVVIDLAQVNELGLEDYAVEVLAHEIGHHVLAPGSATDQFRLLARIRKALPTLERHAPMVANLYTDLYINDKLQRQAGLRMADIYRALHRNEQRPVAAPPEPPPRQPALPPTQEQQREPQPPQGKRNNLWTLYMRIYENLWQLDRESLVAGTVDEALDTDAWLGARVIRVYAGDWMNGAGKFASLLLPYLLADGDSEDMTRHLLDTGSAAEGCEPHGAQEIEAGEIDDAVHPVRDARISGLDQLGEVDPAASPSADAPGQTREPFDYGEILKAAGIKLSDHEIAVRYYRERALANLVVFPTRSAPDSPEPHLEALEAWQIGDPLDQIDWLQSVLVSPQPIPGLTTVQRSYGQEPGRVRQRVPVDLDLYVDSSGSMPNPQQRTSFLTLAGAVIAMSALRAGSSVQVTLWSGKGQVMQTQGFVRNDADILRVLTGFYGGGTCFPIHRLRETFSRPRARPTHILMISDDGITTMFDQDEQGNSGWDVAATALEAGGAGGTMALNIRADWDRPEGGKHRWQSTIYDDLRRARRQQGWEIHAIAQMEELLEFARAFSRRHYAEAARGGHGK